VLGNAVECETKEEYDLLAAASALMATYFGIMHRTTEWLAQNGLPEEKGRAYLAPLFAGLSDTALLGGKDIAFIEMSHEFATKGGLNEQVFRDFEANGGSRATLGALDRVLARIRG
jgi:pyrroline-5-carboxylate reductase